MNRPGPLRLNRLFIVTTALALVASAGAAQENDLQRCAQLTSDAERLACFDALTREPAGTVEGSAVVVPPQQSDSVPEVETGLPPAEAPATTQPEANVQETQPTRRQDDSSYGQRDRPREYTATVVAIRERAHGQVVVTLDNGEVWSEQYASRRFLVDVGDTITMKTGVFSSGYRLIAPGGTAHRMTLLDR